MTKLIVADNFKISELDFKRFLEYQLIIYFSTTQYNSTP